jgi:hypothetical protein
MWPREGDTVAVVGGKWDGRVGTLARYDVVLSGQVRLYPVVQLLPSGRQRAREVRVCVVIPAELPPPPADERPKPLPVDQLRLHRDATWVHRKFAAGEVSRK